MKKIINFLLKWDDISGKISIFNVIFLITGLIVTGILIMLGLRSCDEHKDIEKVQCFMGETVLIHEGNYEVIVHSCETLDAINYLNKNGDIVTEVGNFIAVKFDIKQLENSDINNHDLDANDFKLKDHTGAVIPLNDILGLVNIDAADMIVTMDENQYYVSDANIETRNAIKDYSWVGKELSPGTKYSICVYFDMPEGYRCEEVVMVLEIDLFYTKGGTDIALAFKKEK